MLVACYEHKNIKYEEFNKLYAEMEAMFAVEEYKSPKFMEYAFPEVLSNDGSTQGLPPPGTLVYFEGFSRIEDRGIYFPFVFYGKV